MQSLLTLNPDPMPDAMREEGAEAAGGNGVTGGQVDGGGGGVGGEEGGEGGGLGVGDEVEGLEWRLGGSKGRK